MADQVRLRGTVTAYTSTFPGAGEAARWHCAHAHTEPAAAFDCAAAQAKRGPLKTSHGQRRTPAAAAGIIRLVTGIEEF
jgi:hypothetical protein